MKLVVQAVSAEEVRRGRCPRGARAVCENFRGVAEASRGELRGEEKGGVAGCGGGVGWETRTGSRVGMLSKQW